jgi:hypothetical protein
MRASRRRLFAALLCVTTFALSAFSAATESNQEIANRVLGSQWQSLSQRAGMIFAGTVLSSGSQTVRMDRSVAAIELRFRVDRPIAGVDAGQVLTIHEWAGASSGHRPLRRGEHILIFLYPPSRLGLTSPVGGSLGQIGLDSTGQYVAVTHQAITQSNRSLPARSLIKVSQLERAIRAARGE